MKFVHIDNMISRLFGNEWWEFFWDQNEERSEFRIPIKMVIHDQYLHNFTGTMELRGNLLNF